MKRFTVALFAVLGLALVGTGCEEVKKLVGMEEKKAEEAAPAEAAKPAETPSTDQATQDALKKAEEAKAAAEAAAKSEVEKAKALGQAEADKAKAEAEAKAAGAMAQVDKAKAEGDAKAAAALAEAESTRKLAAQEVAKAQEEKAKAEEAALKLKKDNLANELKTLTEEHAKMKTELATNLAAWKAADAAKAGEREAIMAELTALEGDRAAVEAFSAADKLDDARNKLDLMKAKFAPLKEKVATLVGEKPVDPAKWTTMLNILTEETCMTQANLPAQEFQKMREVLFAQYEMDRVEYETLRAQFTRNSKPEDQAKLGEMVAAKCPPKAAEAADKKNYDGKWTGTVTFGGKTDQVTFTLKGNTLTGSISVPGASMNVTGGVATHSQFAGRRSDDFINCHGKRSGGEISGTCIGALNKKRVAGSYKLKFKGK